MSPLRVTCRAALQVQVQPPLAARRPGHGPSPLAAEAARVPGSVVMRDLRRIGHAGESAPTRRVKTLYPELLRAGPAPSGNRSKRQSHDWQI
jgi:hypothetical protein